MIMILHNQMRTSACELPDCRDPTHVSILVGDVLLAQDNCGYSSLVPKALSKGDDHWVSDSLVCQIGPVITGDSSM